MSLPASLDLVRLLQFQAVLSTAAGVGTTPQYNLPIFLYGLIASGQDDAHLSNFTALLALSAALDIVWLVARRGTYGTFSALCTVALLTSKLVTFLAAQAQLGNRGQPAFPTTGETIWAAAMPGGFTAQTRGHGDQSGQQSYQREGGYYEEDEESTLESAKEPPSSTTKATPGGYQSL